MLACLAAAALLGSATPVTDPVIVHEWGVVVYSAGTTRATGSPAADPLGAICADAPVLYFHGAPFTGDVAVCSLGEIFSTYPEPDQAGGLLLRQGGLGSAARWEDLSVRPLDDGEPAADRAGMADITIPGFGWATGLWRAPQALWILRESDRFRDRFLYYEVDLTDVGFPVPLPAYAPADAPDEDLFRGEVLVFRHLDDGTVDCTLESVTDLDEMDRTRIAVLDDKSCETAAATVRRWADGLLGEDEIQAMWATWEPFVLHGDWGGGTLVVFPMPGSLVERISTIVVTPDSGAPVECSRFFLGMKAI